MQRLENDPPDLILLDILLPGENGRDLCREVKEREQTRHIPVFLFSAHVAAESPMAACGADDFLAKPFRMPELLEIVARRWEASPARSHGPEACADVPYHMSKYVSPPALC